MKTIIMLLIGGLAIGLMLFIFWLIQNKVKIKWKTFLKKGFAPKRGDFGVYTYDGKQGKGKNYSLVEYLIDNRESIATFCNIADIKNINYVHFTGFEELIKIKKIIDYNYIDIADLFAYIVSLFPNQIDRANCIRVQIERYKITTCNSL